MSIRLPRKTLLWSITIICVLIVKIFSINGSLVESFYSNGIYPKLSAILTFLFGWLPFSLGDVLYIVVAALLLFKISRNLFQAFKHGIRRKVLRAKASRLLFISCWIYIIFNVFWGFNYNRLGIGWQLQLPLAEYSIHDLDTLNQLLLSKVNSSASADRSKDNSTQIIFKKAQQSYLQLQTKYSFLRPSSRSLKSSMFGKMGDYLGFTGYYNPFTGEAQANTTVPVFLQPYICTHEIAHQLGYAKEDEANFVGYLAASNSNDSFFHYSTYLDLFLYANRDLFMADSSLAKSYYEQLSVPVKEDINEWRRFNLAHQSFIEPAITWMYSKYLQMNQQPKGMRSYNQVTAMLIAYYKKYNQL